MNQDDTEKVRKERVERPRASEKLQFNHQLQKLKSFSLLKNGEF